jgi:hypothetical protein
MVICPASILPRVSRHGFWAAQSLVTEPGPAAAAIDRLPSGPGVLRAVCLATRLFGVAEECVHKLLLFQPWARCQARSDGGG